MIKPASFLLALVLALSANAADDKKAADPAVAAAMQKVNATGASLMPVAADAKTFRFTALNVAKEFTDAGLDAIAPIADKLSSLDLARTKITDAGLAKVAAMNNERRDSQEHILYLLKTKGPLTAQMLAEAQLPGDRLEIDVEAAFREKNARNLERRWG